MELLNKEEALRLPDKSYVSGLVLMGEYTEAPTKNGGSFLMGTLQACGDVSFKVWSGPCYNDMISDKYTGKIVFVEAEVNEYGGVKSFILQSISDAESVAKEEGYTAVDFMFTKYDIEAYYNKLISTVKKKVSPEAFSVYSILLQDYVEEFKNEFAAINYHDNCRGGLLAHTAKVVNMCSMIKMYPNILNRVSMDVIFVGAALHDLGKTIEYKNGSISDTGMYLSHNIIGVEMVLKHKAEIIELKGEEFYKLLLSIISQHHGEYGDRPRTVAAFVVHQFDLLESTLALLDQVLESSPEGQVKFDGMKLI